MTDQPAAAVEHDQDRPCIDTRPLCPFCKVGHLSTLVSLIICAYCQKAWQPFEFELDLRALDVDEP